MIEDMMNTATGDEIHLKALGVFMELVVFKIYKFTPLRILMDAYCEFAGLEAVVVRFMFDGQPINGNDTPISLEMKEGDVIDVFEMNTATGDEIHLKALGVFMELVVFKIYKFTPLRILMDAYCEFAGLEAVVVRFMFDGQPINGNDTPISLEMKEGDVIDVFEVQTGGRN